MATRPTDKLFAAVHRYESTPHVNDPGSPFWPDSAVARAKLLAAVDEYAFTYQPGFRYVDGREIDVLRARAAVYDAIESVDPEYTRKHGGKNTEPECSLCVAVNALRDLQPEAL